MTEAKYFLLNLKFPNFVTMILKYKSNLTGNYTRILICVSKSVGKGGGGLSSVTTGVAWHIVNTFFT